MPLPPRSHACAVCCVAIHFLSTCSQPPSPGVFPEMRSSTERAHDASMFGNDDRPAGARQRHPPTEGSERRSLGGRGLGREGGSRSWATTRGSTCHGPAPEGGPRAPAAAAALLLVMRQLSKPCERSHLVFCVAHIAPGRWHATGRSPPCGAAKGCRRQGSGRGRCRAAPSEPSHYIDLTTARGTPGTSPAACDEEAHVWTV